MVRTEEYWSKQVLRIRIIRNEPATKNKSICKFIIIVILTKNITFFQFPLICLQHFQKTGRLF